MRLVLAGLLLAAPLTACSSAGSAHPGAAPGDDAAAPVVEAGAGETDASKAHDAAADARKPTDSGGTDAQQPDAGLPGWTLTWHDEFDGADGSPADSTRWAYDTGGGGWGNAEREYYTDGTLNAVQKGGYLVVTAASEGASKYSCWYGACLYTSARLETQGIFSQQYGRFDVRAQMPIGQGLWPAFWMMGANYSTVGWPACGEIDVMETIGSDVTRNHGSMHSAPNADVTSTYTLPNGARFSDAFHTFTAIWAPGVVTFYVDGAEFETIAPSDMANGGGAWVFDQPFFLLIDLAVGGQWPGDPDSATVFPQSLKVDWVRVYTPSDGG